MPDIPANAEFLYLGLGATAVLVIGYIVSLAGRYRNLQQDEELIEQLRDDE